MPAPSKFNKCEQAILRALRGGSTRTDAAQAVGIDRHTLTKWIQDNAPFSAAVTRAEAECANRMAASIHDAARKHLVRRVKRITLPNGTVETETVETREFDWRAAESWLKRRRPDEWSENVDVSHRGEVGHEHHGNVNLSNLSTDELLALRDMAERAARPAEPEPGAGETGGDEPT